MQAALAIPTGGGKTLTALRAVNKMLVGAIEGGVVLGSTFDSTEESKPASSDERYPKASFLAFGAKPCSVAATVKVKMLDAASKFPLSDGSGDYDGRIIQLPHMVPFSNRVMVS